MVGLIAMLLGLVPSSLLVLSYSEELSRVEREAAGLPINEAWHEILKNLQGHRIQGVESLSIRPDAGKELAATRQHTHRAIQQLTALLDGRFDHAHIEAAKALGAQLDLLGADLQALPPSLVRDIVQLRKRRAELWAMMGRLTAAPSATTEASAAPPTVDRSVRRVISIGLL
ncbi:hypothetical protein [Roseateles sp.]|uniref:hypothetical protein n=1 Tax=Roseateles sp. TaxID=1971397 RepID=UPI00286A3751|nr:hypothetical protein [Roseateles sp.]